MSIPVRYSRTRHKALLIPALAVTLTGALAACGGASSDSPSSSGATSSSASASASPTASSASLVGRWEADAADVLNANTANAGGPGGLSCTGRITMTFTAEGRFTRAGRVSCSVAGTTRAGAVASGGTYTTVGDTLTIGGARSTGSVPDSWGNGTATYAITGSTLTITFNGGSAGTITQQYQRV